MQTLKLPKTGVVLHYLKGPYGPTIRIDTTSRLELLAVRSLIVDLAQGQLDLVNLVQLDWITAIGIDALILRRFEGTKRPKKSLKRKKGKAQKIEFEWSLSAVEWWECVNLIDGLLEGPGHQYLTDEEIDDAIIELAYLESKKARERWSK
ncbi:MAG: hypothetical protein U1E51_22555 [Candidatus Binatia bacterium]|nr:hypothetical protein [Candidatus Binatia bacterium]